MPMPWIARLALVLALALPLAVPAFAADTTSEPPPEVTAQPPLFTPADSPPEGPEIDDPATSLRVETIRACTPQEETQCPAVCACLVISNQVRCFGSDPSCTG